MTTGCASLGRPANKRLVNNGCQSAFRPIFRGRVRSKLRAGSLIDSELHTKGGTVMGKSANGPDILDCGPMMEAIGTLHGVDVSLTILPGGGRWPTGVEVLALAVRRPIARPAASYAVSRRVPYPNKDSATFEGC